MRDYSPNSARKRFEGRAELFSLLPSIRLDHRESGCIGEAAPPQSIADIAIRGQFGALLEAAETFNSRGKFGKGNRQRIRAMLLLLRYSGLRISDAAVLARNRLQEDKLFLYAQKTGTPVWLPLPPRAVDVSNEAPSDHAEYFFWNGRYTSICHGDLNMQYVLLDERENIYVIDFSETRPRNIVSDLGLAKKVRGLQCSPALRGDHEVGVIPVNACRSNSPLYTGERFLGCRARFEHP